MGNYYIISPNLQMRKPRLSTLRNVDKINSWSELS
jgi:hypothetical protein